VALGSQHSGQLLSLALGLVTLVVNLISTPLSQAGIYFYPAMLACNELPKLRDALQAIVLQLSRWFLFAFGAALIVIAVIRPSWIPLGLALGALIACDCWRSLQLSMVNAARLQRRYAIWSSVDTWLRPLLATVLILSVGQSATGILVAYVAVSLGSIAFFQTSWWDTSGAAPIGNDADQASLITKIWRYAAPLIPLGILGWAMNIGDRYMIGALMSAENVGVYAAVYGLSSAPVTIIGGTIELIVRPIYQHAVSSGESRRARQYFWLWLAAVTVGCGIVEIIATVWRADIARLFLGPAFRHEARLIPWIAGGYAVRCVAYVFERACYAHGETRHVFRIQLIAALAALIVTPIGIVERGVLGAAMAVPIYFFVQLVASIIFAAKSWRQNRV